MVKDIYSISYKMKKELYERIFTVSGTILLFVIVLCLILSFIVYPVRVKSDSMCPDIPVNSIEFVSPLLKNPERGQVVLIKNSGQVENSLFRRTVNTLCRFISAQQWEPFTAEPKVYPYFRRVVGLPGDTIYLDGYLLFIKPAGQTQFLTEFELTKSKYNISINVPSSDFDLELGAKGKTRQIVLKENEYYVLGDNRLESSDSRIWGPVKSEQILASALVLYYPFNKIRLF